MAVERQQHRIRQERAGQNLGESNRTKPRSETSRICRERPELIRCASRRPRDGAQGALEVPFQGKTLAQPEPPLAKESANSAPGAVPGHTPAPNPLLCPEETGNKAGS
eukprot:6132516-Pleurochrysis_carterae.AAC.1